jgi:predicted Ser/Thr protein kinase
VPGENDKDELGQAPTTPAPPPERDAKLAAGSGNPDSTLDMPAAEQQLAAQSDVGNVIGHFKVIRKLGQGGMGVVLECEDADLGRPVALKLVRNEAPAYRARLLREAQAMARLEHPNVVRVYEVGSDRGRVFVAMELVQGETLTSWMRQFRTWQDVVDMFVQVGAGLAAVHNAGLVHRDFKPDNVLVDRKGRARVADFGLARVDVEGDQSPMAQPLTRSDVVMGTPGYMAPEQHLGSNVDARADQYSFCIALREALGGRPVDETRWRQVPEHIRAVVNRGLSYDPSDRFPTMPDLMRALRAPPAAETVVASRVRDPKWMVMLLVLAVLGSVAGIVAYVSSRKSPPAPRQTAAAAPVQSDADVHVVAPADAASPSVVVETPPVDAAFAPSAVTTKKPHRDAGVDAATLQVAATPPGPAPGSLPTNAPPGSLPTNAPPGTSPSWGPYSDAWQKTKAGNVAAIRAAVKDVGYDGLGTATKAELQKLVDQAVGTDRAVAQAQLGMLLRRAGDCKAADALFVDAIKALPPFEPKDLAQWRARAGMARTLCTLAAGKPDEALEQVLVAINNMPSLIQLVRGIIAFEQNDRPLAYAHLITAAQQGDATVKAAAKTYLDGYGLKLGP